MDKDERWQFRTKTLMLEHSLTQLQSKILPVLTEEQAEMLKESRATLRSTIEYAPTWVLVAVAIALGAGTMVGWKRIVVTVGEKIGKTHLTYSQGASAELVAMTTIGMADILGMPVSTTHVLSSGVAGSMAANKSGSANVHDQEHRHGLDSDVAGLDGPRWRPVPVVPDGGVTRQPQKPIRSRGVFMFNRSARLLVGLLLRCAGLVGCDAANSAVTVRGAGATLPAPLYKKWFADYRQTNPAVRVSYMAVGSGPGIQEFTYNMVDFGASDLALTAKQIDEVPDHDVQLVPMAAVNIVIGYNVPGVTGELKLSREAYTGIFLGTITSWDDSRIAERNKDATLPRLPIKVIYRAGASGTTGAFSKHLCAVSDAWKKGPGEGLTTSSWPTGTPARATRASPKSSTKLPALLATSISAVPPTARSPWPRSKTRRGSLFCPPSKAARKASKGFPSPSCRTACPILTGRIATPSSR